ncbi:hypothetical protein F5Y13DRAFT_149633 [Hypoxylon sp. FL1857]|nr:hypothetical protein F5Y13DRAFT_149633 [Hypoxylon sp. FL1857]
MRSIRPLLLFVGGTTMFGSSVGNESPASKEKVLSHTFQPGGSFSGTLRLDPNQTLEYFRNEIGVDIDKLRRHPELFPAGPSGNYTFPEGSGAEGTISWSLAGQNSSTATAYKRMTCLECEVVCSLWAIPFTCIM